MLRVRVWDGAKLSVGGEELLDAKGTRWVDIVGPTEELMAGLATRFGLHRLAVEDCLHLDQRPKLEEYQDHQFLVLQGFSCAKEDLSDLVMHELHFFLGADWLITVHEQAAEGLEAVSKRLEADPAATIGRGADFVAYLLADALVDRNFPVMDTFADVIEGLEELIFENPTSALLQEAMRLKRDLVTVRRVLSPQRDVMGILARRGVPQIQDRTAIYFRDVYDHLVRLYEQIEAARDLLGNAVDAYLSVIANRTADVSKQLTIFASIFMPLSFVVGFFGQNFDALNRPLFFWSMLVAMVAIPTSMVLWMRHKRWW